MSEGYVSFWGCRVTRLVMSLVPEGPGRCAVRNATVWRCVGILRNFMKNIIYFLILLFLFASILPEQALRDFVMSHLTISGDGEEAMDDFYFSVLVIKVLISSVLSFAVTYLVGVFLKKKT
ncbi:hypothetical protein Dda3937_02167 [Dickeya dadantii 3937]|uniref:Uncharacterized protein n=1 Tax=Dickeya dadantii (strain 3937) TaxID=198628 RepID=E0SI07_DICD3|nr:hypothetical protein [Dickeya dadantii]ADN00216.1 hypothetical protein Dda3937_02167 [Dickeya dadantii 3937]